MVIIRSKAPFRVSFGGGGTDMAPYCMEYGGCVISTTIDRYVFISLKPRYDKKIRVYSVNYKKEEIFDIGDKDYNKNFKIFKGVVNVLGIKHGFDITVFTELPAGSGMGGSSSLCVALIGAFDKYYNLNLSKHEIALKAYHVEKNELNQRGGYQDQFAAVYGGLNFIEFSKDVKVIPIKTNPEMINEIQFRMILCYVGGSHISSEIQDEVIKKYDIEKKTYIETMQNLKDVALSMKKIIESNDINKLNEFGKLLHKGWLAKKSLSSKISSKAIENFYLTSRKFGVLGGKLLGAGGGGHLLLFCDPNEKFHVIEEMERIGGKIETIHFNPLGLQVWKF